MLENLLAVIAGLSLAIIGFRRKPPIFGGLLSAKFLRSSLDKLDYALLFSAGTCFVLLIVLTVIKFW